MPLKEFFRYELVANERCDDCGRRKDVIRVTTWFADEGDREVLWHQCCKCLRDEFRLDCRDDLVPQLRALSVWLRSDKLEPLISNYDIPAPEERGGQTMAQVIRDLLM